MAKIILWNCTVHTRLETFNIWTKTYFSAICITGINICTHKSSFWNGKFNSPEQFAWDCWLWTCGWELRGRGWLKKLLDRGNCPAKSSVASLAVSEHFRILRGISASRSGQTEPTTADALKTDRNEIKKIKNILLHKLKFTNIKWKTIQASFSIGYNWTIFLFNNYYFECNFWSDIWKLEK